jgi:hypothetical protein
MSKVSMSKVSQTKSRAVRLIAVGSVALSSTLAGAQRIAWYQRARGGLLDEGAKGRTSAALRSSVGCLPEH